MQSLTDRHEAASAGNLVYSRDGTIVHAQPDGVRIPNRIAQVRLRPTMAVALYICCEDCNEASADFRGV
jgi:hypothetical protein